MCTRHVWVHVYGHVRRRSQKSRKESSRKESSKSRKESKHKSSSDGTHARYAHATQTAHAFAGHREHKSHKKRKR